MCTRYMDEQHEQGAEHRKRAAQTWAFDAVMSRPMTGCRNVDGEELRRFPITESAMKEFWGMNLERLEVAMRTNVERCGGVELKQSKSGRSIMVPADAIESFQLCCATYSTSSKKYADHFGVAFKDVPERNEEGHLGVQLMPENASWWPVVAMTFRGEYKYLDGQAEWITIDNETKIWPTDSMQLNMALRGEQALRIVWVWVGCVWQCWWVPVTVWRLRMILPSKL